jgi:cell division cycle 20-like protein 1 (cofactor of APC complex)
LKGHEKRVLYLSVGPDGNQIVTGAGDETVRIWKIWDYQKNRNNAENRYIN